MDLAATSLLVAISFFAILIDKNDIYGSYGINENYITLPTLLLFCFQWTLVLIPIHHLSKLPFEKHVPIKQPLFLACIALIVISSVLIIISKASDIRDALLMDMIDVRHEHYNDLVNGSDEKSSPLLIIPTIFVSTPFPTLALFLWFYAKSFTDIPFILRLGILLASIVQAITSIIVAGRSAIVYWIFDFYMLYSFFYRYLSMSAKRTINIVAGSIILLSGVLFLSITVSRFDTTDSNSTPLESLYGYAGQHINNFCTMFEIGGEGEPLYSRIFPFTSRLLGTPYDMVEHYDTLRSHTNALVNVFDTFGAEIFLDLGWGGYIIFFVLWIIMTLLIRTRWNTIPFYRSFLFIILIAFFTRGLFAWPFTGHVTSMALFSLLAMTYSFKYIFKL